MSVIKVENLSKKYIINHEGQERYTAMRDVVARKVKTIFSFPRSLKPGSFQNKEEFYALMDINFEIQQGDRVGIIGRNGAGKSTLLKVLSRITEPTTGKITINGRVASLLEVGTGFHPELTGRENVYLNGAILGMSRQEIKTKFDEIVDFAGIEKFLDTPVKRYSSGMYVRLAFAVAAHLEPEILVVDEVLAVGDAEFQKKCLGKMEDVSKNEGRTVLFVSHNLSAIKTLCTNGILLVNGRISNNGDIIQVIEAYKTAMYKKNEFRFSNVNTEENKTYINNASIELHGTQPLITLRVLLELNINVENANCVLVIDIINADDVCVFQSISSLSDHLQLIPNEGIIAELDLFGIVIDAYSVNVYLCTSLFQNIAEVKDKLFFEILESPVVEKLTFNHKGTGNGYVYPITRISNGQ